MASERLTGREILYAAAAGAALVLLSNMHPADSPEKGNFNPSYPEMRAAGTAVGALALRCAVQDAGVESRISYLAPGEAKMTGEFAADGNPEKNKLVRGFLVHYKLDKSVVATPFTGTPTRLNRRELAGGSTGHAHTGEVALQFAKKGKEVKVVTLCAPPD